MAHELYTLADGSQSIGYVGKVPWHGLGQQIPENTPLEQWPVLAGLNWGIERQSLFFGPEGKAVDSMVALVRSDSGLPLSFMSDRYQVVQPKEILEFYRDLIDAGGFKMHTAGSMFNGKKVWALAEIGKGVTIKGDHLDGYLLLSTSCDGSLATTAQFTTVRVVCNNTLTMAVNRTDNRYAVKVPHHSKFNAEMVKEELGLANNAWNQFEEDVQAMISRKIRKRDAIMALIRIMGEPGISIEEQTNVITIKKVFDLFDGNGRGSDLETAKGTAWGLVNAVTQFADHERKTRTVDARMESAWFGKWEQMKRKAMSECLLLAA